MSGPKCVGIRAAERVRRHQDQAASCDERLARYRRLHHELLHHPLYRADAAPGLPDPDALLGRVRQLLEAWQDIEASAEADRALAAVEAAQRSLAAQSAEAVRARVEEDWRRRTAALFRATEHAAAPEDIRDSLGGPAEGGRSLADVLADLSSRVPPPRPGGAAPLPAPLLERLARLEAMGDGDTRGRLLEMAAAAAREGDPRQSQALLDSIVVEAAQALRRAEALQESRERLARLLDQMSPYRDPALDVLRRQIEALRSEGPAPSARLQALQSEVQAAVAAARQRLERERRRQAILESLRELGYEAQEGLQTALAQGGRLVVQKNPSEEYAVEIVGNEDLSLLQTAMIRFSENPEVTAQQRQRDCEREEAWCADHAALRAKLAGHGYETPFRLQLAPGAHPVRVVAPPTAAISPRRAADSVRAPRERRAS